MNRWEDIIKARLENYISTLPEGCLEDFHDSQKGSFPLKRKQSILLTITTVVAAAVIVALFFIPSLVRKDSVVNPDNENIFAEQTSIESHVSVEKPTVRKTNIIQQTSDTEKSCVEKNAEENTEGNLEESNSQTEGLESHPSVEITDEDIVPISPFVPENASAQPSPIKISPVPGYVAGGSALAAMLAILVLDKPDNNDSSGERMISEESEGDSGEQSGTIAPPVDELISSEHNYPMKMGLSMRFGISNNLYLTTGLNYSVYKSSLIYSLSGQSSQYAHYLGIPLRFDLALVSHKRLELFLGGGVELDKCIYASRAGESVNKDGFSFSLQGVTGIQFNITERTSIYIEPELCWACLPAAPTINTYRTGHPLMITFAAGLRYSFK